MLLFGMALVRILVDGYSMLHGCLEVAPRKPRHSAAARDELIRLLRQYGDATGVPITVFFDGGGGPGDSSDPHSSSDLEILYSKAGQTADDMIERVAHRLSAYGEVLVVTDDLAERDTVLSLGSMTISCDSFLQGIRETLRDLESELKQYNQRERTRFKKPEA